MKILIIGLILLIILLFNKSWGGLGNKNMTKIIVNNGRVGHGKKTKKKASKKMQGLISRVMDPVTINSTEKFDENEKTQVVLCYSNYCGHCVLPKSYFKILVTEEYQRFSFKMVEGDDMDQYPKLRNLLYGYPTIFIIKNDNITTYPGPRDKASLMSYLNNLK